MKSSCLNYDGLVKSQRHQLREKIGCSEEHHVFKGTRVSNGLMTPKFDRILHPVDFLRMHHIIKKIMLCRLLQGGHFHNETRIQSVISFLD